MDRYESYPEDSTIRGDQGEKDSQGLIKWRTDLAYEHFHELDQGGNNQDEHDRLQVFKFKRDQKKVLDIPGNCGSHRHDKDNGHPHSNGRLDLLGYAHERTKAEKTRQDNVVDENRTNNDQK
jgi:hypothetical protein